MKRLRIFFLTLLLSLCVDSYSQEASHWQSIYDNLNIIEESTDNLQKDLENAKQSLMSSDLNLESVQENYQNALESLRESEQKLEIVNQQLKEASQKSQQLEVRQKKLEGRLVFWRTTTITLGVCTAACVTGVILILKEELNDDIHP